MDVGSIVRVGFDANVGRPRPRCAPSGEATNSLFRRYDHALQHRLDCGRTAKALCTFRFGCPFRRLARHAHPEHVTTGDLGRPRQTPREAPGVVPRPMGSACHSPVKFARQTSINDCYWLECDMTEVALRQSPASADLLGTACSAQSSSRPDDCESSSPEGSLHRASLVYPAIHRCSRRKSPSRGHRPAPATPRRSPLSRPNTLCVQASHPDRKQHRPRSPPQGIVNIVLQAHVAPNARSTATGHLGARQLVAGLSPPHSRLLRRVTENERPCGE